MHTAVLLQEVIEGLDPQSDKRYIDATAGEGGHLRAIAKQGGSVLGLEANKEQYERLKAQLTEQNTVLVHANFADIKNVAVEQGFEEVSGVLFDLGLSFWELANLEKGFSYKRLGEELDMRLDKNSERSAADILNTATKDELFTIFSGNSEEIKSKEITEAIMTKRIKRKLVTVADLIGCIDAAAGQSSHRSYGRIFQALRMEVNNEKENLKKGLAGALALLEQGGKLAVISFHSIEDRIVKTFMKTEGMVLATKRVPQYGDLKFERSATLRIGVKS